MTSKKLLSTVETVSMWQLPVVLHMDGTFKLNENEFPVITLGISDGAQHMHIMSLSIISHRTEDMYLRVIQGFKDILCDLFPHVSFNPKYLMTDAERAERTALVSIFPEADPLMCYFHVIKASKDKLSGNKHRDIMLKDITSLHMSQTQEEFDCKWTTVFNHWMINCTEFALYFKKQWVEGEFKEWKIFNSSPGCATTNNSLESFNATLKKCFTDRKRYKVGKCIAFIISSVISFIFLVWRNKVKTIITNYTLFHYYKCIGVLCHLLLNQFIHHESLNRKHGRKPFMLKRAPTREVLYKVRELEDDNRYLITKDGVGTYLVENLVKDCCYVVDVKQSTCGCPAYAKWGYCKHIIYFLQEYNLSSSLIKTTRKFVNRGNAKKAKVGRVRHANSAMNRL